MKTISVIPYALAAGLAFGLVNHMHQDNRATQARALVQDVQAEAVERMTAGETLADCTRHADSDPSIDACYIVREIPAPFEEDHYYE